MNPERLTFTEACEDTTPETREDVRSDYGRGYADALDDLRIGADRYAEHRRGATPAPAASSAVAGLILAAAAVWAGWQLGSLLGDAVFGGTR